MSYLSIITCTYNRADQLKKGIMSIIRQWETLPPRTQIVIVDDGSTDNTQDIVNELVFEAQPRAIDIKYIYVDYPEPRISCIPRNIGIKQASGDLIIFTEPEGLHVGNTIADILKAMDENPNRTILASQVWTMGQKIYEKLTDDNFKRPITIIEHPYAQMTSGDMQNMKAPDSDWAISGEMNCNAGILFGTRKEWLLAIGGFNEEFEGHGFDDFDLFNRLAAFGKGIYKIDNIPIIHLWHKKDYPYNIYDMAEKNGKISEAMIAEGKFKVNEGKEWGVLEQ